MSEMITSDEQANKIAAILPKLQSLQVALEEANPNIHGYLKAINEDLRQYPELTILLTDEQIKPIYSALRAESQAVIAVKESKKRGAKVSTEVTQTLMGLL
jgi:hypothetical protein